jgi:hypothetical protein
MGSVSVQPAQSTGCSLDSKYSIPKEILLKHLGSVEYPCLEVNFHLEGKAGRIDLRFPTAAPKR